MPNLPSLSYRYKISKANPIMKIKFFDNPLKIFFEITVFQDDSSSIQVSRKILCIEAANKSLLTYQTIITLKSRYLLDISIRS